MSTTARQRRISKARRAEAVQALYAALKDMPVRSLLEGDDEYGFITAVLGPRHRVILAKGGASWLIQRRDIAVGTISRRAWRKLSAHATRDELLVAVAGLGLTVDTTVMETLLDLPEWASMAPSLLSEVGLHSTPGVDIDRGPNTLSEMMARRRGRLQPFAEPAPGGNKETEDLYRKGVCRLPMAGGSSSPRIEPSSPFSVATGRHRTASPDGPAAASASPRLCCSGT